ASPSRAFDHPSPQSRFKPTSTAAASVDPPPRPAATGIRLSSAIRAPRLTPAISRRVSAALSARLVPSVGTSEAEVRSSRTSASSSSSRSDKSTACMTVAISWYPSSRRPSTSSARLILHAALSARRRGFPDRFDKTTNHSTGPGGLSTDGLCFRPFRDRQGEALLVDLFALDQVPVGDGPGDIRHGRVE